MNLLFGLLPSIIFTAVLVIPSLSIIKYFEYKNKDKSSPLNGKLLRNPGYSLQEKIEELSIDLMGNVVMLPVIPIVLYSSYLGSHNLQDKEESIFIISLYIILSICSIVYFSLRNYDILKKRNKLRLACECEMAVGQELHNSLIHGFKIFHDFPANQFNIDHIAIGPSGVFAIETKGRAK